MGSGNEGNIRGARVGAEVVQEEDRVTVAVASQAAVKVVGNIELNSRAKLKERAEIAKSCKGPVKKVQR